MRLMAVLHIKMPLKEERRFESTEEIKADTTKRDFKSGNTAGHECLKTQRIYFDTGLKSVKLKMLFFVFSTQRLATLRSCFAQVARWDNQVTAKRMALGPELVEAREVQNSLSHLHISDISSCIIAS